MSETIRGRRSCGPTYKLIDWLHSLLRSRGSRSIVLILGLCLAHAPSAYGQRCLCSDQREEKRCNDVEEITDIFGVRKRVTNESACSFVKRACDQTCSVPLTNDIPTLANSCSVLVQAARDTQQRVNTTRRELWSNLRSAAKNIGLHTVRDVDLYNFAAQASFSYNAYAGTGWYQVTMPAGVKLEEGKVKSNLHGNYNVPDMDPKAIVSQGGFIETKIISGYEGWASKKKSKPNAYVYVSSKRFVETVALDNIAQQVGWAIVTYGQTAKGSIETLKEQLVLEWADILKWLTEVGVNSSQELAAEIAKGVLENGLKNGRIEIPASTSLPNISADVELIEYEYEIGPSLSDEMKPILSLIGYEEGKKNSLPRIRIPHLAFSFSISRPGQSDDHYEKLFSNFNQLLQNGPAIDIGDVADAVGKLIGIDLGKARSFKDVDGSGSIRKAFAEALSKALAEAKKRDKGSGLFDFTDSDGAKQLEANLRGLMIGNARDAKVTRLAIDVSSATISLDVDLLSKHRLLKVDILKELDALWKSKDELESGLFNDAFALAKSTCDKLAGACKFAAGSLDGNAQFCGSAVRFDDLALEPLSSPIPSLGSAPFDDPKAISAGTYFFPDDLSLADPVMAMFPPVTMLHPNGLASCHSIAIGGRYILVAAPPEPLREACRRFQEIRFSWENYPPWKSPAVNPISTIPVETDSNFVLLKPQQDLRFGTAILSDEKPQVGEQVVTISVLGDAARKDCRVGPNPTNEFFDLECAAPIPPSWIFSRRTNKVLGYYWSHAIPVAKFVNSSPLLRALAKASPKNENPFYVRGFVPIHSSVAIDLPTFLASSVVSLTGSLFSPRDRCAAVRIAKDYVLVPGCGRVYPTRIEIYKTTLRKEQFDIVAGDDFRSGKSWQVDSTKLINSPLALLANTTLGPETRIATLATRTPQPGEAVITVWVRKTEKAVRGDCSVDTVSNGAIRLKCPDGISGSGGSGMLLFSRVDGTLIGFSARSSAGIGFDLVSIASILNDLPQLRKISEAQPKGN